MAGFKLDRRQFLQVVSLSGLSFLLSCTKSGNAPYFISSKETLPKEWLSVLPAPWRFRSFELDNSRIPFPIDALQNGDLIALGDGWLSNFPTEKLQSFNSDAFLSRLDFQAINFLSGLDEELSSRVLPIGVSPWVLLFRNGEPWLEEAKQGWDVLLDSDLRQLLVLPESPRIVIALANQMQDPDALKKLRMQALTFDDRNGLNWLLSGKARVVVMPLSNAFKILTRDPRLSVALPKSGSPLNWTVLVRPSLTREPIPKAWIEKAWRKPLLSRLLGSGWRPPLKYSELKHAMNFVPEKYQSAVLPDQDTWMRCWSLPTLTILDQKKLEGFWSESTP